VELPLVAADAERRRLDALPGKRRRVGRGVAVDSVQVRAGVLPQAGEGEGERLPRAPPRGVEHPQRLRQQRRRRHGWQAGRREEELDPEQMDLDELAHGYTFYISKQRDLLFLKRKKIQRLD